MYNKEFDFSSDIIYQKVKSEGEYNVNEIYHLEYLKTTYLDHLIDILIKLIR